MMVAGNDQRIKTPSFLELSFGPIFLFYLLEQRGEKMSYTLSPSTTTNSHEQKAVREILAAIDHDLAVSHPAMLASIDTVYPDPDPVLQTGT